MTINRKHEAKLEQAAREYDELSRTLSDPAVLARPDEVKRLSRMLGALDPVVTAGRSLENLRREKAQLEEVMAGKDADLVALAAEEMAVLKPREERLEAEIAGLIESRERGPGDGRGAILEIRAGTGGAEAGLFAADMLRMYLRFAERRGWRSEIVEMHQSELGGVREAVVSVDGKGVWRWLKYEGGVHRVQRVPATEAAGRIHTSAVSVAALPQAEEVDVEIRPEDIRIDRFCSSGAGGQSVNTTYSAVRIVHIPTGIVVQCQDERSQIKNKARALKVLRARLLEAKREALHNQRGQVRREQVKTGDRSDKIRTYNYPQNRVTDHRFGVTVHQLGEVLDGDLHILLDEIEARLSAREGEGG